MVKRLFSILTALLLVNSFVVPSAQAVLTAYGPPITPHGYPAWYQDSTGLQLELCVPAPAGNATRTDLCIGDPLELNPDGTPINPLVMTGEGFYWMAFASIPLANGGAASIEFAIESTFGGAEAAIDGQQITFGRTRIRIDTPVAGTYTITHPYGTNEFVVVDPAEGINYTADIGSANFLNPALGFRGTLAGTIGPFLTWENFDNNPALQVLELDAITGEPTGKVLEQYVGDPNLPSPVVGSPFGNNRNFVRVDGPAGSNLDGLGNDFVETNLFGVMGKVNDPVDDNNLYAYTNVEVPNLFAVGPVNRVTTLVPTSSAIAAGDNYSDDYSLGYPHWYQENIGTVEAPVGGLQLTLCPPGNVMCISAPIIPTEVDPNPENGIAEGPVALMTGGEGFWYSAAASFPVGDDSYAIEFALESTFGGDGTMKDGNQISFTRERIRFNFGDDKPAATYRVTHPYGVRILEPQPDRLDRVRFVADIGIGNLADPDGAYVGALYGIIGPKFLKWNTFVDPSTLAPEALGANYPVQDLVTVYDTTAGLYSYHVGNPTIPHEVTGGPNGNIFKVERLASGTVENGSWVDVGETNLFTVSGKIFDPATFEFNINPDVPIAVADAATFNMLNPAPYIINVAGNDLNINVGDPVTVTVATQPATGTAVANNPLGTITYTPNANFALAGGVDTFTYQISQTINNQVLTSSPATVTVTIVPVETITVNRAVFNTRNLRLDLRGDSNFPGTSLTIHAGAANGPVLGTALVDANGGWTFRGTATTNVTSVTFVSNSAGATSITQPLQVR